MFFPCQDAALSPRGREGFLLGTSFRSLRGRYRFLVGTTA